MHTILYMSYHVYVYIYHIIEGSLKVKLPKIWTDENEVGRVREEKRRSKKIRDEKESEERRCRCAKVEKSQITLFFQCFGAPEGRKVGSLKRRVRTTFGSWDVEKVHAIVARSTCRSQNAQNAPCSDHFWKLRCRKSARRCGAKQEKCKKLTVSDHFWKLGCGRDSAPCQKWAKREGFVAVSTALAGVGHFKRMCKDACRVAGAVQETRDMFIRDVRRSGRWFPERGGILERQIFRFAKMILRNRWVQPFVWPGLTFWWQAQYFKQMEWKNRKTHWHEAVTFALNFPFLKDVSQSCFFLMLSNWNIEEVSQNCCVFDVVNFEHWGSLEELLRFWCCQVPKLRKSRRIASFSSLQINR